MLSRKCRNRRDDRFSVDPYEIKGEQQDVIMYGGMDATGGPFAKQGHQLAMNTRLLSGDGLCEDSLSNLAGTAADRVVCSIAGMPLEKTAAVPLSKNVTGRASDNELSLTHHSLTMRSVS